MTDVVSEVKDAVVVEKEIEKTEKDEAIKEVEVEKNGDSTEEEKTENGDEVSEKVENGSLKENGITDEKSKDTKAEGEVCGIKRKSEVGLESEDAPVETTEKKQKVEETAEPEVASNGVC